LECIEIIRYFIKVIVLIQCLNFNNILTSSKSRRKNILLQFIRSGIERFV
jgi:hypothetical protein